jgi:UDP-glucuronate decarboxylase
MGSSELIFRGHDETQPASDAYSPKPPKPWLAVTRPIRYLLLEQRLVFILVGIAIATLFFTLLPSSSSSSPYEHDPIPNTFSHFSHELTTPMRYKYYEPLRVGLQSANSGGKIPLGLKSKSLRIVVTGGAGFVGSHLVDRLIARGDSVIVVDNFFTGRKENVMHHFKNPRFELIRHDVVEPLLLEVDQIYHLACPASPVHYKHNPVKTIKTNVVGTLNMLGLAKRVGARFLLTSTSEVYGDPLQHPQVETYWGNVNPIGAFLLFFS